MKLKDNFNDVNEDKITYILEIKNKYNDGELTLEEARSLLHEKMDAIYPHEIAIIEQELEEFDQDECVKEDIQAMVELFDDLLVNDENTLDSEHPIQMYIRENEEMEKRLLQIEDLVQYPVIKNQWDELYEDLSEYRVHLSRKQNQLYPLLEKKGFDRPTTTMWILDDYIRDEITSTIQLLNDGKEDEFISYQQTVLDDVRDLIQKENTILYPTSLQLISDKEFEEMKDGDLEIGYSWIHSNHKVTPKEKVTSSSSLTDDLQEVLAKHGLGTASNQVFDVRNGKLTLEQINLIYRHLPVDISYVDENELVCFYSDTEHRVFPRSKNVIGRDVKNCHPRTSVHVVEEIIEKFRSGEEETAEFWINKPDIFIYIYYVAVRDDEGNFRGVLEMMQDCTHIRSLVDSRTLLTWEDEEMDSTPKEIEKEAKQSTGELSEDTKLKDLLDNNPSLKDKLIEYNSKFKILNSPLAKVMLPSATVGMMSERTGIEVEQLLKDLEEMIG